MSRYNRASPTPTKLPEIDIEAALVWALADQRAGDDGLLFGGGQTVFERIAALGCWVDGGGGGLLYGGAAVDGDAEAIAAALARLSGPDPGMGSLLREAAWSRTPPAWRVAAYVTYADRDQRRHRGAGQATPVAKTEDAPDGGLWCRVLMLGGPEAEALARRGYRRWWDGLVWLVAALDGVLEGRRVIGPAAHPAPWEEPARDVPARHCSLLSDAGRKALLRAAARGVKPADLAVDFRLDVTQVYEMLKRERVRHTRG